MSAEDLGAELWALVYHLFAKYGIARQKAVQELAMRTHTGWSSSDLPASLQGPEDVKGTAWYKTMKAAFEALRTEIRKSHTRDMEDARDLVRSLYPSGCNVSEYADAVRTSAAMLPRTVPSDAIEHYINKKGDEYIASGIHVVDAEALVTDVIEELMLGVLLPPRWWCQRAPSLSKTRRVGVRGEPPTLYIEYERPAGVTHVRIIRLDAHLRENMPTAQLARRLACTHEALLSETQLQTLLIRCQRAMGQPPGQKRASADATMNATGASTSSAAVFAAASPTIDAPQAVETGPLNAVDSKSDTAQKADLGLLYRDPEAALHNVDLNDADDVTLREFKEVMDERFKANVVKPGDPDYVYDKRRTIAKPAQKSDWDDDSD